MAEQRVSSWARASGIALGLVVVAQLAIGLYLNSLYTPTVEGAHPSVRAIRESGFPRFLQNAHYWGSAWLIVHGFLHVALMLLAGTYRNVSKSAWLGSAGLFFTAFAMQVTGNLLPFDRHDVQTAVIEGNIAAGVPLVGDFVSTLMMNGKEFGPATLRAWHAIHLWLIAPLAVCGLIVLFAFPGDRTRKPWVIRYFGLLPLIAIGALALGLPAPWGEAAAGADYTAAASSPSWYTLPMHVALRTFDGLSPGLGWIGAMVLPGLFAAVIFAAPWLGNRRDRLVRGAFLVCLASFAVCGIVSPAPPAAVYGYQEPPTEGTGSSKPAEPVDAALAARGFDLAKKYCAFCHGPDLKGGRGFPDLTRQSKRHADADYFRRLLKDPKAMNPGARMPGFAHLPESELAALAEWLREPKK